MFINAIIDVCQTGNSLSFTLRLDHALINVMVDME